MCNHGRRDMTFLELAIGVLIAVLVMVFFGISLKQGQTYNNRIVDAKRFVVAEVSDDALRGLDILDVCSAKSAVPYTDSPCTDQIRYERCLKEAASTAPDLVEAGRRAHQEIVARQQSIKQGRIQQLGLTLLQRVPMEALVFCEAPDIGPAGG